MGRRKRSVESVERMEMKRKYLICNNLANNKKSAGMQVFFSLQKKLEDLGYYARFFNLSTEKINNSDLIVYDLKNYDLNEDVVVYPEAVGGNPLRFRNVVRYITQDPDFWGMSREYDKRELIFAFDEICYQNVPYLRFDTIDRTLFFDAHLPKDVNCYFVYKRGKFREVSEIKGWTEINMSWPEKREDLAKLLQHTEWLYSYDDRSSILAEAELCGAKVRIINENDIVDYTYGDQFDSKKLEQQMSYFIYKTQNMNNDGGINYCGSFSNFDYLKYKIKKIMLHILYCIIHIKKIKKMIKENKIAKYGSYYFISQEAKHD